MLTPTQQRILNFIQEFSKIHRYAPSLEEIALALGISKKSKSLISRYIHKLKDSGHLELTAGRYRHIKLNHKTNPAVIPLLGAIAAGAPIEAIEHPEEIDITEVFSCTQRSSELFALKVKGDSMQEEGILEGDIVICEKMATAYHGDIVVALIDQCEATLKRIHFLKDNYVKLIPANIHLKPMTYLSSRITIQGIYKGLLRLPHSIAFTNQV